MYTHVCAHHQAEMAQTFVEQEEVIVIDDDEDSRRLGCKRKASTTLLNDDTKRCVCMYVYVCMHACIWDFVCVCVYEYMHVCLEDYICKFVCMARMCASVLPFSSEGVGYLGNTFKK